MKTLNTTEQKHVELLIKRYLDNVEAGIKLYSEYMEIIAKIRGLTEHPLSERSSQIIMDVTMEGELEFLDYATFWAQDTGATLDARLAAIFCSDEDELLSPVKPSTAPEATIPELLGKATKAPSMKDLMRELENNDEF